VAVMPIAAALVTMNPMPSATSMDRRMFPPKMVADAPSGAVRQVP
jgi:hypothetical protein